MMRSEDLRALGFRILRAAVSHLMTCLTTLVTPKRSRRVDVMTRRWSLRLRCTEYRLNVSHIFHTSTGTALVGCDTHCAAMTGPLGADHCWMQCDLATDRFELDTIYASSY